MGGDNFKTPTVFFMQQYMSYQPPKLFTAENVEITDRVANGLTKVFICKDDADRFAKSTRSYTYPVYKEDKNKGNRNITFYGYAVPK